NAFIINCITCKGTNPNLYWLVFADCIFTWVVMLLSFSLFVLANIVRRRQEQYQTHLATLASLESSVSHGLSPLELSRLRTFSFHSMSKSNNTAAKFESLTALIPMNRRSDSKFYGVRKIENHLIETSIPYKEYPDFGYSEKHKITIISQDLLEKMELENQESEEKHQNLIENKSIFIEDKEEYNKDSHLSPHKHQSAKELEVSQLPPSTRSFSVGRAKSLDIVYNSSSASVSSVTMSTSKLNQIVPLEMFHKTPSHEICVVCFETYKNDDRLRELACSHVFHKYCIDEWLLGDSETGADGHRTCPLCVQEAIRPEDRDKDWLENKNKSESENFQELILQTATPSQQEPSTSINRYEQRRFFGERSASRSQLNLQLPLSTRRHDETEMDSMECVLKEGEMGLTEDLAVEVDE
ncbi:hypothetical protein HK096_003567, partial [Nowakowskiella sp. JEL0078]